MERNKNKATFTLAATTLLFFLSYYLGKKFGFGHTFWGGLLTSAFSAAMIGGLADWFAVEALFRRPLYIPFRTNIIPKNRERIFAALVAMVENELLTSRNIREALAEVKFAEEIVARLSTPENRARLKNLVLKMLKEWLAGIDPQKSGEFLAGACLETLKKINAAPLLGEALAWSIRRGFSEQALDMVIEECRQLVGKEYMKKIIMEVWQKAQDSYAADSAGRNIVLLVMESFLKLTPEKIAELVQEKLTAHLGEMKNEKNMNRLRIKAFLVKLSTDLKNNPRYAKKINIWKTMFLRRADLAGAFARILSASLNELSENDDKLAMYLSQAGAKINSALQENPNLERQINAFLVNSLSRWARDNHQKLGQMVSDYLNGWDNARLVSYIEQKVGNDLQMIRINGSVVGGLAGIALYLVTFCLGI